MPTPARRSPRAHPPLRRPPQLDPEHLDELRAAVDSPEDEDVGLAQWSRFHASWRDSSTIDSFLKTKLDEKKTAKATAARERKFAEQLAQAKAEAAAAAKQAEQEARPQLMAEAKRKKGHAGDGEMGAAELAAQHRTLDPAAWTGVIAGVGGLVEPLEEIRRRIWVPLCAPLSLLDELGATRVKGLLLHGPPGCGKSLLASRLAAGLSRRPPTLVSGPEIMDKFVGSSEQQLRALFTRPPRVPARPGDAADVMMVAEENELHVIVLDEFDAIARRRSGGGNGASEGVSARDSVVNQLLALMDGVADLPTPTFVIALTNRRELVDNAVLRPGRLEVHVEVGKPDATGREAILRIHAEKMRESGRLALAGEESSDDDGCTLDVVDDASYGTWIEGLSTRTSGFSGAALAAVVRAAVARALDRAVAGDDAQGCRVSDGDFDAAIADLRSSSLELEELSEGADEADDGAPKAAKRGEGAEPEVGERTVESTIVAEAD